MLNPKGRRAEQPKLSVKDFEGRTWLTRPRPGIDRAGSAWLIRKFIDAKAKFVFGSEPSAHPKALPFDMMEAQMTFSKSSAVCPKRIFPPYRRLTAGREMRSTNFTHIGGPQSDRGGKPSKRGNN